MKLHDMVEATKIRSYGQHVLLYGHPKVGKTFEAAKLTNSPKFKRVFWFDFEKGASTLLNPELALSEQAKEKLEILPVLDSEEHPYAIETALKMFHPQRPTLLCESHGRWDCALCKKENAALQEVPRFDSGDLVVLDSLSAIADSALALADKTVGNSNNKFARFGLQGDYLKSFLTLLQHADCHIVAITHVAVGEDEATGKDVVAPACGTRNFSLKCGRYFDAIVYRTVELKQYKNGSTPTYKMNTLAGSRRGVSLEDGTHTLADLF